MKWGRKWGRMKIEKGFSVESRWGAERNAGDIPISGRQDVRIVRGKIVPCDGCKKKYNCAMYQSLTRNRMRNNEYMSGTNILHKCEIYVTDKIPGSDKAPQIHGRTSGKQPT